METIHEPGRDIPVLDRVDVIVAGGGPAGLGAAIAAARNGAKTMLIERNAFLGGVATAAPMPQLNVPDDKISGITRELFGKMIAEGSAYGGVQITFDHERLKELALETVVAAGAKLLLYSTVVGPVREGNRIKGVIVENKSGRQAILADVVVDTTGDADLAAQMGAPYVKGRESDGKMRPVTVLFRLGNVNIARTVQFARQHPDDFSADPKRTLLDIEHGAVRIEGFYKEVKAARERGELDKDIHYLRLEGIIVDRGMAWVNNTRVYNVDGTNALDLTRAEVEARRQMRQLVDFIKRDVAGCENSFVIDSAASIGVRETRRIRGDIVLTEDHFANDTVFDDAIVRCYRRAVPGKEIHSPDGGEGGEEDEWSRSVVSPLRSFQIPYGSLIPKGVEGMLVAGKTISGTHEAERWFRGIYCCIVVGQGAGTAAALATKQGVSPRQVDVKALQARLAAQGVDLGAPIPVPAVPPMP